MRIVVWCVACLLGASSCGSGRSDRVESEKKLQNPPTFSISGDFAAEYVVEDIDCQRSGEEIQLQGASIFSFENAKAVKTTVDFTTISSAASLKGDLIFNSKYGFHQVSQCQTVEGEVECGDNTKVVQSSTDLKICQPQAEFDRHSVEGVGLSGIFSLEQAFAYYNNLAGKKTMRQARLLVLPKIEKKIQDGNNVRSQFVTDNLAYAPNYLNEPAFVIFPKSKVAVERGLWTSVNLWEVPWAMAHEFGHHVFRTHTGRTGLNGAIGANPIHSFDDTVSDNPGTVSGFGLVANGPNEIWSAFNEGFADLYATYVNGDRKGVVDGFDCFEQSRDVFNDTFANGRSKRLDSEVIRIFNSSSKVTVGNCKTPNFQDIHIIGAIVAHGLNSVWQEGGYSTAEKSAALLAWANQLGGLASGGSDKIGFVSMLEPALQNAGKGGNLNARQCRAIEQLFPAVYREFDVPGCSW